MKVLMSVTVSSYITFNEQKTVSKNIEPKCSAVMNSPPSHSAGPEFHLRKKTTYPESSCGFFLSPPRIIAAYLKHNPQPLLPLTIHNLSAISHSVLYRVKFGHIL
jgi:hypothetical protein